MFSAISRSKIITGTCGITSIALLSAIMVKKDNRTLYQVVKETSNEVDNAFLEKNSGVVAGRIKYYDNFVEDLIMIMEENKQKSSINIMNKPNISYLNYSVALGNYDNIIDYRDYKQDINRPIFLVKYDDFYDYNTTYLCHQIGRIKVIDMLSRYLPRFMFEEYNPYRGILPCGIILCGMLVYPSYLLQLGGMSLYYGLPFVMDWLTIIAGCGQAFYAQKVNNKIANYYGRYVEDAVCEKLNAIGPLEKGKLKTLTTMIELVVKKKFAMDDDEKKVFENFAHLMVYKY